jgi:hypothetical protein
MGNETIWDKFAVILVKSSVAQSLSWTIASEGSPCHSSLLQAAGTPAKGDKRLEKGAFSE